MIWFQYHMYHDMHSASFPKYARERPQNAGKTKRSRKTSFFTRNHDRRTMDGYARQDASLHRPSRMPPDSVMRRMAVDCGHSVCHAYPAVCVWRHRSCLPGLDDGDDNTVRGMAVCPYGMSYMDAAVTAVSAIRLRVHGRHRHARPSAWGCGLGVAGCRLWVCPWWRGCRERLVAGVIAYGGCRGRACVSVVWLP